MGDSKFFATNFSVGDFDVCNRLDCDVNDTGSQLMHRDMQFCYANIPSRCAS